jgi:phosphoribosylanthranilate isomerase
MVRVKVCCISTQDEAELAKRAGASAIGLVSRMPSSERAISDRQIQRLARANGDVQRFLLTSKTDPCEIGSQVASAGTDTVQLVDALSVADLARLRTTLPEVSIVQVVHVTGPSAIERAREVAPVVDAVLLDSGTPDGPTRMLGGTGNTHDWKISAQIVDAVKCPVYLAGGLGPDNVREAIERVRPYGVDVCSRLRPQGGLEETLLSGFMHEVRGAHTV